MAHGCRRLTGQGPGSEEACAGAVRVHRGGEAQVTLAGRAPPCPRRLCPTKSVANLECVAPSHSASVCTTQSAQLQYVTPNESVPVVWWCASACTIKSALLQYVTPSDSAPPCGVVLGGADAGAGARQAGARGVDQGQAGAGHLRQGHPGMVMTLVVGKAHSCMRHRVIHHGEVSGYARRGGSPLLYAAPGHACTLGKGPPV
jgi:hypothetical protein